VKQITIKATYLTFTTTAQKFHRKCESFLNKTRFSRNILFYVKWKHYDALRMLRL